MRINYKHITYDMLLSSNEMKEQIKKDVEKKSGNIINTNCPHDLAYAFELMTRRQINPNMEARKKYRMLVDSLVDYTSNTAVTKDNYNDNVVEALLKKHPGYAQYFEVIEQEVKEQAKQKEDGEK